MNLKKKLIGGFLPLLVTSGFAQANSDVIYGAVVDGATSTTGSKFSLRGEITTDSSSDNSLITISNGAKVGQIFYIPLNGSVSYSIKWGHLYNSVVIHMDDPYYQNNPECPAGCDWVICSPNRYGCDSAIPQPLNNHSFCVVQFDGHNYNVMMKKAC